MGGHGHPRALDMDARWARPTREERHAMDLRKSAALTLGAMLLLAACKARRPARAAVAAAAGGGGGKDPDGALVKRADIKIEVVTHGQAQDGFWGVVRNGVKAGGNDMGVTVNYSAPGAESDMPAMSALIDAAVAKKPSGLVVSIPNADALSPSIKKAVAAGHPGRVDELGLGRVQGPGHPRPRRADRIPGRPRRRQAVQGRRRQERRVLQPGSRQPGADPPLQRLLPRAWAWPIPRRARS